MTTQKLNLTRNELATFLKSHEQIKQFERMFQVVDEVAPSSDTTGISINADNAYASAALAIAQIIKLAQNSEINTSTADRKATQALTAINCISSILNKIELSESVNETKVNLALNDIAKFTRDALINVSAIQNNSTLILNETGRLARELLTNIASVENKANQAITLFNNLKSTVEGMQMAPPAREFKRARYGQFYDTTTQAASAINTAQAITFNTSDVSNGVYLGSPSSRIVVDTKGIYNFLFSIQLDKTAGGTGIFWVWPRINGVDVPNSNSQVQIQGNNAEQLVTVGYFFELNQNDYVEIMFAVNDITVQVDSFPASAFYPAIPSIILTVSDNIQGVK